MSNTQNPNIAFQERACDCAGLLTLLHRALADETMRRREDADWAHVGDLQRLRENLMEALVPTRNLLDDEEAKEEIEAELKKVRPRRV